MSFPQYSRYKDSGTEWLGKVPEHWQISRISTLYSEIVEAGSDDLPILSVSIHHGVSDSELSEDELERKVARSEDKTKYKRVRRGDLAYNMMRAWQGAFGSVSTDGMVSPAYTVARPKSEAPSSWVEYLLRTGLAAEEIRRFSRGITDFRLRLYWDEFKNIRVCIPPAEELDSILTFLDRETAKIDGLITEQQRLIELLQEKRQAVISHAVTKGLNPNAPMKDSGVEWLGEVPEHWSVRRLRYIGTLQNGLNIGAEAFGEGDPFISYGDVYNNPNVPTRPAGLVRSTPEDKRKYGLEEGDVLFTRTSEAVDDIGVASTCLAQVPNSTFAGFLIRLRPFQGELEPRYSTYLFRNQGVKKHFAGTMNIVTRASLSQGELGGLCLCLPPLEEQLEIAIYIEEMTEKSDELISSARNLVSLLQERRSALISAAVTGQIDVRGLVPEAGAA